MRADNCGLRVIPRLFVIAATLCLANAGPDSARGGYLLNLTELRSFPGEAADDPMGSDFVTYVLSVQSDDESAIRAVDIDLTGAFRQDWRWDTDVSSYAASGRGTGITGGDSHLLPSENALIAVSPIEDNSAFPTSDNLSVAASSGIGLGSRLAGVWGVPGDASSSLDLAYLVLPRGADAQLEYRIGVANDIGQTHYFYQGASFPEPLPSPVVTLPEPAPIEIPVFPPTTTAPTTAPPSLPLAELPPVDAPPEIETPDIIVMPIIELPDLTQEAIWNPSAFVEWRGLILNRLPHELVVDESYGGVIAVTDFQNFDSGLIDDLSTFHLDYFTANDAATLSLKFARNSAGVADFDSYSVPEPASWLLLAIGGAVLRGRRQ